MKKKLCLISVLMVLVLALTACGGGGGGGGTIEGKWKVTDVSGTGDDDATVKMALALSNITMEFNNGVCTTTASVMGQSNVETSSYSVDGNKLIMNGTTGEFKINGNTLTIIQDGVTMTLTRQ